MVTTLLTAVGVFAVRNIAKIDQAVGFSRQGNQTMAVAEMGATATLSQIAVSGAQYYADNMDNAGTCQANGSFNLLPTTCYRMRADDFRTSTGKTLFEQTVPGNDTGSFGPLANTMGYVSVEMTEKYKTNFPVPGAELGKASYMSVTLTSTGNVRPYLATTEQCTGTTAVATSKRVMRAHTIIGPLHSP